MSQTTEQPKQTRAQEEEEEQKPAFRKAVGLAILGIVLLATAFRGPDGKLTVHLMNDGAARDVEITGLPSATFRMHITDSTRDASASDLAPAGNKTLRVKLPAWSLVTLSQP